MTPIYMIELEKSIIVYLTFSKEKNSLISWLESPEALVTTRASGSISAFFHQRKRWISKVPSYTDKHIIITGAATFIVVLLQLFYLIGSLFNPGLISGFLVIFLLKSVPDYLIIHKTVKRYNKPGLMRWFLPSQLIYPFYVILVVLRRKWKYTK